jgi:hypothetical protein
MRERFALVTSFSADGFGPLEVTIGIQLDDIDIPLSCAEGVGGAGDGVAAIGGLNEGVAPSLSGPPMVLVHWRFPLASSLTT